ncbi:MAG: transcription antitermination factor NusB [Proteobacteria bacterium]|nr:transcription antitermination factor NusB [Pseudomonadota bacterium]MCP4919433.1 transcription antitermination factor NusB [Pseudomonadota bacterium]
MASRRKAREYALQALYTEDQTRDGVNDALNGLWSGLLDETDGELGNRQAESQEVEFATNIAQGVIENLTALDERIEATSTNWRVSRMAVVDRNILRMATYELLHMKGIPANVSINEAVELAKKFGTKDSRGFVNGILDRIARDAGVV